MTFRGIISESRRNCCSREKKRLEGGSRGGGAGGEEELIARPSEMMFAVATANIEPIFKFGATHCQTSFFFFYFIFPQQGKTNWRQNEGRPQLIPPSVRHAAEPRTGAKTDPPDGSCPVPDPATEGKVFPVRNPRPAT